MESREQEEREDVTDYRNLLEENEKKLGYKPKDKQYEEFLDLVSSIGGELD